MGFYFKHGLCFLLLIRCASSVVETKYGPVEGITDNVPNGKTVEAFLGIPYAAPPLGDLRFAPPQPVTPWDQTLMANQLPKSCYQAVSEEMKMTKWYVSESVESEDCLYLNVWRPKIRNGDPLAVMFWIYGGALVAGSSNLPLYNGGILATQENVIVVTINYRLSMFGLLYLNTSSTPGNAAMRDQIQAMEWVQDNIAAFGGDPKRVTLFGESAGSSFTGFYLQSYNLTYHLFNNAILQSGSSNLDSAAYSPDQALQASLSLARNVGCLTGTEDHIDQEKILTCLNLKTPKELIRKYLTILPKKDFIPVKNGREVPFSPGTAFLEIPPDKRKNVLLGSIPGEVVYFLDLFFPDKVLSDNLTISEQELRSLLSSTFVLSNTVLQDVVLFQYTTNIQNSTNFRKKTGNILSDASIVCQMKSSAVMLSTVNNKVYLYSYTHRPSTGAKVPIPEWAGAVHGDEIPFEFGAPLDPSKGYTPEETLLSKKVMAYWTHFAKTGNPNGGKPHRLTWPELKADDRQPYLEIDVVSKVKHQFRERECAFWATIYPELTELQGSLNNMPSSS